LFHLRLSFTVEDVTQCSPVMVVDKKGFRTLLRLQFVTLSQCVTRAHQFFSSCGSVLLILATLLIGKPAVAAESIIEVGTTIEAAAVGVTVAARLSNVPVSVYTIH